MKNNSIEKRLRLEIVIFPILLIIITISVLTYNEIESLRESYKKELDTKTKEYIRIHKNNIKNNVLSVDETINFLINDQGVQSQNLPQEYIQAIALNRYKISTSKDKYFFIYKLHNIDGGKNFATMILNNNKPELVGKIISDDYLDAKGKPFRKEFMEQIRKNGEAYVKYWYKHPMSNKPQAKISYFYLNKEWNWIIAQGFYFDALDKEISLLKNNIDKVIAQKIEKTIRFTLLIILVVSLISYFLSRRFLNLVSLYNNQIIDTKNQLEQSLKHTNELLFLFDKGDSVLFKWKNDEKWSVEYVSKNVNNLLGRKKEDFLSSKEIYSHCIHKGDIANVVDEVEDAISKNLNYFKHEPYRIVMPNKTIKWVSNYTVLIKDQDRNITHFLGYIIDITKEHLHLEEINGVKNRFVKMFNNHISIMLLIDVKNGDIVDANKSALSFYGYSRNEFLSMNIDDINQKDENLNLNSFEFIHRLKNNQLRTVEVHSSPIQTENGTMLFSIIKDISEEKKLHEKILNQKDEFETIFNASLDGIAVVDLESRFLNINSTFEEMSGYTKSQLLTLSCEDLSHKDDIIKNKRAMLETINQGQSKNTETVCIRKDGTILNVNVNMSLFPDKKKILIVVHDLHMLKMMQDQSRLASMGEMIGNIAHQWRQPLSIITTAATGVLFYKDMDRLNEKDLEKEMNTINNQAQYLSKTIDDFRDFIKGETNFSQFMLKELIASSVSLVEATLSNNYIKLVQEVDEDMLLYGAINELKQAIINMINNAKDKLKESDLEEKIILLASNKIDENSIEIIIHDNGGGIPKNIINNIFDPYFTTKHKSQGTGLGLSMVDKIIRERHSQHISVSNETFIYKNKKYYGACFKIRLKNNIA